MFFWASLIRSSVIGCVPKTFAIVPGFFPAEQNRKVLTPDRIASIMGHTPMKRFGETSELVGATLLLASGTAGGFITGDELIVDGGYHAMGTDIRR